MLYQIIHHCALLAVGHDVVNANDLSNSSREVLDRVLHISRKEKEDVPFVEMDVTDEEKVDALFVEYGFDGVIHFAGFKAVGESVTKPAKVLLQQFAKYHCTC